MKDETNLLRAGRHSYIEVGAITVHPRHRNRPAPIVAGVFRRLIEGVDRPSAVVAIRPEVVDSDVSRGYLGNRRMNWKDREQKRKQSERSSAQSLRSEFLRFHDWLSKKRG